MLEGTRDELNKFAKAVIKSSRQNLTKKGHKATGALYKSLDYDLNVSKNSFSLEFIMSEYGAFVDLGVKGKKSSRKAPQSPFRFKSKMPPSRPLDKWIKTRGIRGRNAKGQFITNNSLSYLIRRNIRDTGLKASLFFTKPFEAAFKHLPDDLIEQFGLDIDDFIDHTLPKEF